MKPPSILLKAEALVNGDRQSAYGPVAEDFGRAAEIFFLLSGVRLTVPQFLQAMQAVKLSRERYCPKEDNRLDLCGYTELLNQVREGAK